MALSLSRKTKEAEATPAAFECVESFSTIIDGAPVALRLGTRVAADHPAYAIAPGYFRPINSADIGNNYGDSGAEHIAEPAPKAKPKPKPKLMRAKRTVSVDGIVTPDGRYWQEGRTVIEAGQEVPADHPIVKNNKGAFEKVKP
jgi:hypothetical protein